ncbi:alpha/beta fold hydrolase [Pseudonocardia eucalypti]|uniref:Alpha/beta fold hydrolase n=1 Tax=Pseudonocardia eucalypti TaxID=648755 RepID=A0ABP9Q564_9PSEU|nr:haloalkane dehalogenase [Pseudonocardia eucalypti]
MARTIAQLPEEVRERYPYESRFMSVNGRRMHYIDEGPADAPPVLLLHGNPAWGFLWRDVVPPLLAEGLRVVVPDQIGFGLSEKPHDHDVHTLDNHAANLVALMDRLDLRRLTMVCHDWGGPTGLSALATRPERGAAVAIMSTWAWVAPSAEFHHRVLPWRLMHAPLTGPHLLGRQAAMPGRGMYLSVVDRDAFAQRAMAGHVEVLGDPDERALTWIWPRSIPLGRDTDRTRERFEWLERKVRDMRLPAMLIWGREDDVFTPDVFLARWRELWPHAEGPHMVTGRHFLQEDSGPEIGRLLARFAAERVVGGTR